MIGADSSSLWASAGAALWLGILTSISPCPLASNIAAVSYVARDLHRPGRALAAGLLYAAGRVLAYTLLGWIILSGLLSAVQVSDRLQSVMNQVLGPILILAAMFMLELLRLPASSASAPFASLALRASRYGFSGALLLGAIFALSFCPVSAALFFGSLLPLALSASSPLLLSVLYGTGTGLPVVCFAAILGSGALGPLFSRITSLEFWARRATGTVFLLTGIYYTLNYVFEVFD